MKRLVLALALVGATFAASALPPPGGSPPGSVSVSITNPLPLPVSTVPSWTPVVEGTVLFYDTGAGSGHTYVMEQHDSVLKGIDVHVFARNFVDGCSFKVFIGSDTEGTVYSLLAVFNVPGGSDLTYHYSLPDLYLDGIPVGTGTNYRYYATEAECTNNAYVPYTIAITGVKIP